jgi:hypothetical protein
MNLNILSRCMGITTTTTTTTTTQIVPSRASRAWETTGWTYCVYDFLDHESALNLCTVNRNLCEDFREKYMRWKKTYEVVGRRTFIQSRTCGACGLCTDNDADFVVRESAQWTGSGKCYITCKSTECYMKALTSMYTRKTFDCRIDNVWGSSIQTQYLDQDIPREITINHEFGVATDAVVVATKRSNRVTLYCCGGILYVNIAWESLGPWKDATGERGMEDEYTTVRDIRTIWEMRTPENQETIERFIRRTIGNIDRFVRQTRVWGEEVSEMWERAGEDALNTLLVEKEPMERGLAPSLPGAMIGTHTRV